jgi:PhzF family phenazine biosynthesis protein
MPQRIVQVDAFTDRPFAGNPAAVCVLPEPRDEAWMQAVALEMNLSETAFLVKEAEGFHLRWFTPAVEVDLCGHATLASAHVLWEEGHLPTSETARFRTRSGWLTATTADGWITLDFPAKPVEKVVDLEPLATALDVRVVYCGTSQSDILVEVRSEEVVRGIRLDSEVLQMLEVMPVRGIIVTARSESPKYDFVSRFFAPSCGVPEDPVTGSAHCTLGPYWAKKLGRNELVGYQASSRGGLVRVKVEGDRVLLGGQAVTVLRGELVDFPSST